jgi:hypothetical protein
MRQLFFGTIALSIFIALASCSRADKQSSNTATKDVSVNTERPQNYELQQTGTGTAGKPAPARAGAMSANGNMASSNSAAQTDAESSKVKSDARTENRVAFNKANLNDANNAAFERKIIRNAVLTLELKATADAQRKIESIAEARGGFTVTSESVQRDSSESNGALQTVTVTIRVPASQFDATIDEIRKLTGNGAGRVRSEKITGQDVTEEYVDLESRLRAQRALEAQLLEIMKRAVRVSDALEVQNSIGEVRTEIERLEGRRRFLENQSSLSTITVTLSPPAPLIATTSNGFFHNLSEALSDGIEVAAAITLGLLRFVIALLPVLIFIGLPVALVSRFVWQRARRRRLAADLIAASEPKV